MVKTSRRCLRALQVAGPLLLLLCLLVVAARPAQAQQEPVPTPVAPPSALAGAPLFAQNCAACHGPTGNGDGPTAPSLPTPPTRFASAPTMWTLSPSHLFSVTHNGRIEVLMPPWSNQMSDLQIWNSVAYAWSLHTSEQEITSGERLYAAECADCHGVGGAGGGPESTSPMADFSDQAWAMTRSQADLRSGWLAAHPEIGGELLPDQQRALLEYVRSFTIDLPWSDAYSAGEGAILATVEQGTADGSSVEGLPVTLDAWLGSERVATFTTTVEGAAAESSGTFTFTELSTNPNLVYVASVAHEGVSYSSDLIALSPLTPSVMGTITVFDTTSDASVLRIDRLNWIVETQPLSLTVGMIYAFGNTSDRTFTGERSDPDVLAPTVAMQIPNGAINLAFENGIVGGRFVQEGDVVYDTLAVAPGAGTRQIILRYTLPYTGTTAEIAQSLLYTTSELNLFVGDVAGLEVDAPMLAAQGVRDIGTGANYQFFTAVDVAAQTVEVGLAGLPEGVAALPPPLATSAAEGASVRTAPLMPTWAAWLVGVLAAATLIGALVWARGQRARDDAGVAQEQAGARDALIAQIALLDDLHAAGSLAEDRWQNERQRLMQQLKTLTKP